MKDLRETGLAELVSKIKQHFATKKYFQVTPELTEGNEIGTVKIGDTETILYAPKIQSDWAQNDEEADDYIKNRTHYDFEDDGVNVNIGSVSRTGSYSRIILNDQVNGIFYIDLPDSTNDLRSRDLTMSYNNASIDFEFWSPVQKTYTINNASIGASKVELLAFYGNTIFLEDLADYEKWNEVPNYGNSHQTFAFYYLRYDDVDYKIVAFLPAESISSFSITGSTVHTQRIDTRYLDLRIQQVTTQGENIANFYGTNHIHQIYATPTPPIMSSTDSSVIVPPNKFMYCPNADTILISSSGTSAGENEYTEHLNTWEFAVKAPATGILNVTNDDLSKPIQWNQPLINLTVGKWYYCKVYGNSNYGYWGVLNKAAAQGIVKGTITIERSVTFDLIDGTGMHFVMDLITPNDKIWVDENGEKHLITDGSKGYLPLWNFDWISIELDEGYSPYEDSYDRYNGPKMFIQGSNDTVANHQSGNVSNVNYNNNPNFNMKIYDQMMNATATTKYEYYSMLNPITYMFDGWTMKSGETQNGYTNNYAMLHAERVAWIHQPTKARFTITFHATELVVE